jgi:hypothetical protein
MTRFITFFLCSVAIVQLGVAAPNETKGINADRAWKLASMYYHCHVSGCGGVGEVVLHGDYWEAPVHFGYAGTPQGSIRVHRYSGTVSYRGHPTVSAESLDAWFARETKHPRAP